MKRRLFDVALILALASPARATDGNIWMFFDPDGAVICSLVPCNCYATLYVYGLLLGASQSGITGAEYAVSVSDGGTGFAFIETFAAPTVIGLGAFPPNGGVNVAWPACEPGDGARVLIETVTVLNLADCSGDEVVLTVTKKYQASNQFFQCPLFVLCDAPVYTKVCLGSNLTTCQNPEPPYPNNATCSTSGVSKINPRNWCTEHGIPDLSTCPVAAEPRAWSGVKALYRD